MRHFKEEAPKSVNTIRNFFLKVDLEDLKSNFLNIFDENKIPKLVHFDGKAIKGTVKNFNNKKQSFLFVVSAYSSDLKQILGMESFNSKEESEITIVQKLIKKLNLREKIITADALHSTNKTMQLIREHKSDYILQVKGNRMKLLKEIKNITETKLPKSKYKKTEKNKNRIEKREIRVYEANKKLKTNWTGIEEVILLERNGKKHYYITSLKNKEAEFIGEIIRKHWSIEVMHYVKDIVMKEDDGKVKNKILAFGLSLLRSLSINIMSLANKDSPTSFIRAYAHNIPALLNFSLTG